MPTPPNYREVACCSGVCHMVDNLVNQSCSVCVKAKGE